MLIIIISRSSLKLDHVGSKTRLLGHQATQVSDLGPLWPSCCVILIDCIGFLMRLPTIMVYWNKAHRLYFSINFYDEFLRFST